MIMHQSVDETERPIFQGEIIYSGEDEWGDIRVIDYHNHRILNFGSIYEQSRMDKDLPYSPMHEYSKAMLLVLLFVQPRSVLLFGLGAGSLLRAIHRIDNQMIVHAVELREKVVHVAREYFGLPLANEVMITIEDVDHYLLHPLVHDVDVIMSDLYRAYDMDPLQKQVGFLENCHSLLSANGWLVLNFHEMPNENSSFMQTLRALFKTLLVCRVPKGNFVLYAGKALMERPFIEFETNLGFIEKRLRTSFSGLMYRMSDISNIC